MGNRDRFCFNLQTCERGAPCSKNWSMQMGIGVITGKASEYYHSAKNKVKSIFDKFF